MFLQEILCRDAKFLGFIGNTEPIGEARDTRFSEGDLDLAELGFDEETATGAVFECSFDKQHSEYGIKAFFLAKDFLCDVSNQ